MQMLMSDNSRMVEKCVGRRYIRVFVAGQEYPTVILGGTAKGWGISDPRRHLL